MIGFEFGGESYASNVLCHEKQTTAIYHLKMVNQYPHLFQGTLILEKKGSEFRIQSPADFNNKELFAILVEALKNQDAA
jgi:hypothetical protein